jgi:hypothetical protein
MQLRIRFPERSSREQSLLAAELEGVLAQHVEETNLVKEREDTQDPGTILAVILGTPAVVGAVSAIGAWLIRKNQSGVTIEDEGGRVIFTNMESKDVAAAIKAVQTRSHPG